MNNVEFVKHNSIKITGSKTIYIDPFKIDKIYNDADYIFITHSHYDHFSPEDISKVKKSDTKYIIPKTCEKEISDITDNVVFVEPGEKYIIDDIKFTTTYAYNMNKKFHLKENKWVGYIIDLDNTKYYIAGDTDNVPELQDVKCDIAFIPIGGTYTMNVQEATNLTNVINAKTIIPTHYGVIVGNINNGNEFKRLVRNKEVVIFI